MTTEEHKTLLDSEYAEYTRRLKRRQFSGRSFPEYFAQTMCKGNVFLDISKTQQEQTRKEWHDLASEYLKGLR